MLGLAVADVDTIFNPPLTVRRNRMNKVAEKLEVIEILRKEMVAEIIDRTGLSINDFTVDVDINLSDKDNRGNEFYAAAKDLDWHSDTNDGVSWYTTEKPQGGATVVYARMMRNNHAISE
jgi:hypothetical protein